MTTAFALVVLDFQIDTSKAAGRFTAGMLAQVAQFERELISERTIEALAEKKAKGWQRGNLSATTRRKIVRFYVDQGKSIAAICRQLRIAHRTSVVNVLRTELRIKKGPLARARLKPATS